MPRRGGNEKVIHAAKFTDQAGVVKYLSVAFDRGGRRLVNSYWEVLQRRMRPLVAQYGNFSRDAKPGYNDWFVTFESPWPEPVLDELLRQAATRLEAQIFIEPAAAMPDPRNMNSFLYWIDPRRRRPNN